MEKLELLARIQKLSSLIHSEDLRKFNLNDETINEMRCVLDKLTEQYISDYC